MYVIPEWAAQVLNRDHVVTARAWASVSGSAFSTPLPMLGGATVKVGSDFVRRTLDAEVVASVTDPEVSPYAAEVLVEYGVVSGPLTWWQPVGTFVVTGAKESGTPGVVAITGADRAQRIVDARLERPVSTSGNTVDAIEAFVLDADPRLTFVDHTGSTAGHAASLWERDRADAIQRLAESIGAVLFFHPDGVAHLWPQTGPNAQPVWTFARGEGGGKVASAREVTRDGVYNSYVVIGEGVEGSPGVTSTARDTDPLSPTRYGGPFGKRPRFLSSSLITTQAQADTAAAAGLARSVGQAWALSLSGLPNPALEVGDVVSVEVAPEVWQRHILDGYDLPLDPGPVSYSTRSAAITVEGEA